MSIKTFALAAAVAVGTLAFEGTASAQLYYSTEYSPGVVTSYYATSIPSYYSAPLLGTYGTYYGTYPAYGSYYGNPYYEGAYVSRYGYGRRWGGWGGWGRRWW